MSDNGGLRPQYYGTLPESERTHHCVHLGESGERTVVVSGRIVEEATTARKDEMR